MYLIYQIFKEIVRKSKGKKKLKEEEDMIGVHEEIVANILTRLPLGSIIRFKLVCKAWRSLIESDFFRHLLHKGNANSTSPYWSILHTDICLYDSRMDDELELNFPHESHGNNWSFKSMRHHHHMDVDDRSKIRVVSCADGLVLLRHESSNESIRYYIGNPVLSQWTLLPPPPVLPGDRYYDSGLVTRMHNGVILGYKVVRLHKNIQRTDNPNPRTLSFEMYSSDTGEWSYKQVSCPGHNPELVIQYNPITLNGKLYWHAEGMDDGIVVYDFFSDDDDQATSIRLPDRMQRFHPDHSDASRCFDFCMCPCYKMICSTSQGFFVFIEAGRMTGKEEGYNVKVWRLMIKSTDDHSWEWETAWEINMASIGIGFESVPMAINNFDVDIIYLWSLQHRRYVAYNVRTQTKYLGPSNRDGPAANEMYLPCDISACFYPRNTLTQFVLSLQEVPKMFSKCS